MISGRSLAIPAVLDKLEVIRASISSRTYIASQIIKDVGVAIIGQTSYPCPRPTKRLCHPRYYRDGGLLIPLNRLDLAKKLAEGLDALVMDAWGWQRRVYADL